MTPEPDDQLADPKVLLLEYLDYYRAAVVRKFDGLSEAELRGSRLPSGWTPLELLKHLIYMERRWLRWGFAGEQVDAPWGDRAGGQVGERWRVGREESLADLVAQLRSGAEHTRAVVEPAELATPAAIGGRFTGDSPPPTLAWVLFHVLQEYARHTGHLDIVRELADGQIGE